MTVSLKDKCFQAFKDEADFWIDVLGLKEWRVLYEIRELGDDMAQCEYNTVARYAFISLNKRWLDRQIDKMPEDEPNEDRARLAAFHEVQELSLADIEDVITDDPKNIPRINTERHRIIRRLENTLFPLRKAIMKERKS